MSNRDYALFFQDTNCLTAAEIDKNIWLTMKSLGFSKIETEASMLRYQSESMTVDLTIEPLNHEARSKVAKSLATFQKYLIPVLASQHSVVKASIQTTAAGAEDQQLNQKMLTALQDAGECDLVQTPDQGWFDLSNSIAQLDEILSTLSPQPQAKGFDSKMPAGFEILVAASLVAASKTGCIRDMNSGELEHLHALELRQNLTARRTSRVPVEVQAMAISAISLVAYMSFSVLPQQVMASPLNAIAHTLGFLN
ncbi:MAG: hypothetical protein P8Q99_06685 [Paracoccaceae bacterium]|nr:hypothetical protein [Paracoccaceae bacterium]